MIRRRKFPSSSGFALLEAVIAVLLTAVVVAGLFSVILTSFTTDTRSDARQDAGLALKMASDMLRSHVAAKSDDVPPNAADDCFPADPLSQKNRTDVSCLLKSEYFPKLPVDTKLYYTVTQSEPDKNTGLSYTAAEFELVLPDEKK
ncbi:MAG: type II secretion system protein [Elusimicrobiales bacterium]|nr:type II secretion system protein [Elusimicrobiales bacterium]